MAFFAEKGISIPFGQHGTSWRYTRAQERVTAQDRLDYLRKQIRPLVAEVAFQVGEAAVLDALGLHVYNPEEPQQLELAGIGEGNARS